MFVNGEVIEYQTAAGWMKGTYIGKYPTSEGLHVICTIHGVLRYGSDIRKPKVKKEGWINVYPSGVSAARHNAIGQSGWIYDSKQEAIDAQKNSMRIALDVVKVEWEE